MKKTMTLFLALLAGAGLAAQPCSTFAGNGAGVDTLTPCFSDSFFVAPFAGGEILDSNDVLIFVVHDGTPSQLGNILSSSDDPGFLLHYPGLQIGVAYQVAAVAGDSIQTDVVDLSDSCL